MAPEGVLKARRRARARARRRGVGSDATGSRWSERGGSETGETAVKRGAGEARELNYEYPAPR
jgi:hypothetical protein